MFRSVFGITIATGSTMSCTIAPPGIATVPNWTRRYCVERGARRGGGGSVVCRLRIHFTGRILDTGLGLAVKVECCCGRREQRTSSIVQRETHNAQRAIFAARRRRGHVMVPHAIPCTYLLLFDFASTLLSGITAHQSTTPPRSAQKEVHGVRLRFAHRNFRCNSTLLKAILYAIYY